MARFRAAIALLAALTATPALAASCDAVDWDAASVATELAAATPRTTEAPLSRAAGAAFLLSLAPQAEVAFAHPPERPPKKPAPHAAVVEVAAGAAGAYRVVLSASGWIDVVQDGALIPATAFGDLSGCPGLRKFVAFAIGAGPFTLQVSDAGPDAIAVALVPAAD